MKKRLVVREFGRGMVSYREPFEDEREGFGAVTWAAGLILVGVLAVAMLVW